jgi:Tfp pilus assembly protein PilW
MAKLAYPISSTRRIERTRSTAGFTLVEILIGFALASFIMTGVMTTFLMMGRSGVLAQNYTELEVEARKALQTFSREARMANAITNITYVSGVGNTSITLAIPDTSWDRTVTAYSVTYTFDTDAKSFKRTGPPLTDPTGASTTTTLVTNVKQITGQDYIRFFRYDNVGYQGNYTTNFATSTDEIKQVELNFVAQRTSTTVATATDKVLSARFILRNK